MHAELGNFWMNLLLALAGFLYGSYRLMKRAQMEREEQFDCAAKRPPTASSEALRFFEGAHRRQPVIPCRRIYLGAPCSKNTVSPDREEFLAAVL